MPAVALQVSTFCSMKHYFDLYNKAYSEIGPMTPISADCGMLCGAKCCQGDETMGMVVFPGEEKLLTHYGFPIKDTTINEHPALFTTCNGRCKRPCRPLSCRIFPLAPDYRDGVLKIVEDPRAKISCPLLAAKAVEEKFFDAVHRAFTVLLQDEKVCDMLIHYTLMLDKYRNFWK